MVQTVLWWALSDGLFWKELFVIWFHRITSVSMVWIWNLQAYLLKSFVSTWYYSGWGEYQEMALGTCPWKIHLYFPTSASLCFLGLKRWAAIPCYPMRFALTLSEKHGCHQDTEWQPEPKQILPWSSFRNLSQWLKKKKVIQGRREDSQILHISFRHAITFTLLLIIL